MSSDKVHAARTEVIRASLRWLSSEHGDEHARATWDAEYADDLLALAARDLVQATDALPADQQPVGWQPPSPVTQCIFGQMSATAGLQRCVLPPRHDGLHRTETGKEWTDPADNPGALADIEVPW